MGAATHLAFPTEIGNNQGDAIKYTIRGASVRPHVVDFIVGSQAYNQAAVGLEFGSKDFCMMIFIPRRTTNKIKSWSRRSRFDGSPESMAEKKFKPVFFPSYELSNVSNRYVNFLIISRNLLYFPPTLMSTQVPSSGAKNPSQREALAPESERRHSALRQ